MNSTPEPSSASSPAVAADESLPPEIAYRRNIRAFGESYHASLQRSRRRNGYFHRYLTRIMSHQILPGSRVLDIGCATGEMLAAVKPGYGVGIDISPAAIEEARRKHPELTFHEMAAEEVAKLGETFDYVILSGVLPQLYDLHTALEAIRSVCHDRTRVIVTTFSRLWQPAIRFGEMIGWKARVPDESWIPPAEVRSILAQCDFDIVSQKDGILLPIGIPLVSDLVNRWLAPFFDFFNLCTVTVGRAVPRTNRLEIPRSVSVIIPARNEAGNIKPLLDRVPAMGEKTEVIFIEGNSTDDTWDVIQRTVAEYQGQFAVSYYKQTGKGKGDAVRLGFAKATGEILMILDADISVPPEELPRFVDLIAKQQCEFANGSRLVYPMEKEAMQFLNMIANKCFGWMFTFLLSQRLRDTLCGTKVLRKTDYEKIVANRAYFGDFDPFGDFDLLFGAARLNLKITDVPVHYKQRVYGSTNISRFRHGWLLLRMCAFAARKIRFI
ncbi:MAG TPA: glycosyltransferase [Phycisphaerae bacterium]|nr:glycosyltransferase [Phycisphaerae bacterium]